MKFKRIYLILFLIIISFLCIGTVFANDSINLTDINQDNKLLIDDTQETIADDCCEDNVTDVNEDNQESKTWYVSPDQDNPNQVQVPTVQPVIDKAKPGDTIILNGTFVHCHFMINKTLTILATPGTSVGVCPHHTHMMKYGTGPESNGVFYISPEAKGTVLSGFSFTNDFYSIATKLYNPFGVFIDADDVIIDNLTFDWVGVKNDVSKYDPKDFLFDSIILNNTRNTTIKNILLYNINSFLTSINASNINTNNVSFESKEVIASSISVSNLNIKSGDAGNLKVVLKDINNNTIKNKLVTVFVNGVSNNVTTDNDGVANFAVKYSVAGTNYVVVYFAGDDDYKASVNTAKIIVTKKATSLTAPKKTFKVKSTKKLSITLKSGKTLVKGKKITVKVNGKTYSAKTNSKGIATVILKLTKKGTFTYTAKFAGDNTYKTVSKKGKVIIKK